MLLENRRVNQLTWLLAIISVVSCAQADVSIINSTDTCTVTSAGQSLALQLKPPCELVKIDYKDHDYYQYDKSKVYIVAGQAAPISQLTKWSVAEEDNCSLQSLAIIVTDGKIQLSAVKEGSLTCPAIGLDEKVYRGFLESLKAK